MNKQSLLYGTIMLLVSNFINKGLGFFYRVFLVRVLGTEGIGLVEMVLPFYTFIIVLTTWGIPLAMSKLLAEEVAKNNWGNVHRIFSLALFLLITFGLVTTTLVIVFLPQFMLYFAVDQRIYFCFITMLPTIFIISVCSVFRGYFQGTKQISVIGFGQTMEQFIRVLVGVTLAFKLKKYGLEVMVIAVSIASVVGEFAGLIFMVWIYRQRRKKLMVLPTSSFWSIGKKLFTFGTPITLTRLFASLLLSLQATLIPRSLVVAGCTLRTATEIYGRFTGVALSLLQLPSMVTISMAIAIMPAVAELTYENNQKLLNHRIAEALWFTTVFAVPGMVILYYYAGELCQLIFHAPAAKEPLRILAFGGLFYYLQQTLVSILQGLGRVKSLLINNICAGSVYIGGILLLTPIPQLGIKGSALALSLSYFLGCVLNIYYLISRVQIKIPWQKIILKPVLGGCLACLMLRFIDQQLHLFNQHLPAIMIISILITLTFYIFFLFLIGGMPMETLKRLPLINKWFS